jgi:hypothetical protein
MLSFRGNHFDGSIAALFAPGMASPLRLGIFLSIFFVCMKPVFADEPASNTDELRARDSVEAARRQQLDMIEAKATGPSELIAAKEALVETFLPLSSAVTHSAQARNAMAASRASIATQQGSDGEKARLAVEISDAMNEIREVSPSFETIFQMEQFGVLNSEAIAELAAPTSPLHQRGQVTLSTDSPFAEAQAVLEDIRALSDPAQVIRQLDEFQHLNAEALADLARLAAQSPSNSKPGTHP